jgi:ubiquitin C-terminal hydrolase
LSNGLTPSILNSIASAGWNPHDSSDVCDFLQFIVGLTIRNEKKMSKVDDTWHKNFAGKVYGLAPILHGQLTTAVRCGHCMKTVLSDDVFLDLPVAGGAHNLITALTHSVFSKETLQDYRCERCSNTKNNIRAVFLSKSPSILVLRLNNRQLRTVPYILDLQPYCSNSTKSAKYMLMAILAYVNDNHYIAVCRQPNGSWIMFDDDKLKNNVNPASFVSCAYSLFYRLVAA